MKRYDIYNHPIARIGFEQREDPNGKWVKYEDVEKELHDLRQVAQDNADWYDQLKIDYDKLQKQNKELLERLKKNKEAFIDFGKRFTDPRFNPFFADIELNGKLIQKIEGE